ncbi:MAG TPA: prolyl oligopeptidase family serine peptidase [Candidatus Melainabacteria bacterium]|nr:prolyl oligopeptidase family serine peptidase [Candidatus Melainabacteria bacterium]
MNDSTMFPCKEFKIKRPMRLKFKACLAATLMILSSAAPGRASEAKPSVYPAATPLDHTDTYHGVTVKDPYRWLEELDSNQTKSWVESENQVTEKFLEGISVRKTIEDRLREHWSYPKCRVPFQESGKLFYFKNSGLQDQDVLYIKVGDQPERVLIDPNKLSEDGTVALTSLAVNDGATRLAYGISRSGSDWQEWYVKDIATGKDLDDHLKWIKFSGASWLKDGSGFFYSRYDEPKEGGALKDRNYYQKLYLHKIGTPQSEDSLIYERKDQKEWGFGGDVTEDGKYLIIPVWKGTEEKNRIFYKDLTRANSPVVELLNKADAHYDFIDNVGSVFYFLTDLEAPKNRVVSLDLSSFDPDNPVFDEVIPETGDKLDSVGIVNNEFILHYLKDAFTRVTIHGLDGEYKHDVKLPGIGTAYGFNGLKKDKVTYYGYTSFNTPLVVHKYDLETGDDSIFFEPEVKFNPSDFITSQVFVKSKDGTRIPLFICHHKDLKLNGENPVYLYGYGGFNISKVPAFSIPMLTWMEMGGVFAQACLRGGGEYGEEWHKAGMKLNKQNVFDDFLACGEWLIKNKYTDNKRLAIAGGSNGGLLVGACLTQRPELFGAACPAVGVMDMLRFHKFTIGWGWVSDYGSADNPDEFKALLAYSPLHNIRPGTEYPATLITTADHDDRVFPAHSFKFAAALQKAQTGEGPILIRIETKAGHGAGKPTSKVIEESADRFAFLARVLKFEDKAKSRLEKR